MINLIIQMIYYSMSFCGNQPGEAHNDAFVIHRLPANVFIAV